MHPTVPAHRGPLEVGSFIAACLGLCLVGCARAQAPVTDAPPSPTPDEPYHTARENLIRSLIELNYLKTAPVIKAMRETPRHLFVPESLRGLAYEDIPLPIGEEQTISAPGVVALMTELLEPSPDKIVLEIGTGSGYQAAVLSALFRHVYTIEILQSLADRARATLQQLGYKNITVRCGDGYKGWPEHAPFDAIIVTCAPDEVPRPLVEQLKEGGRMVIPVGDEWEQQLYLLTKAGGKIVQTAVVPVMFVPMTGEAQQKGASPGDAPRP